MASQTGYYDAGGFGEGIPPDLRSRDLPSKRLLGKGLASIGYETEWKGERYARLDFVGVPSDIFRDEAAALVRLKDVHENVVKSYGLTFDKLSCSLVSEYMDDKLSDLLQKRMDQRKRIPASTVSGNESEHISSLPFELQEALDLMLQIAKGMEYLHEQGILHGDLKTRNILVTYMNNDDTKLIVKSVKVSDFGLARTKRNSMSNFSRQARKLDKLRWKAPEILKESSSSESDSNSDEDCSRSSAVPLRVQLSVDVYSFAMTCSQILTSEEPYPKRNWKGLVSDIVSGKLRPKLPPSCPEMLSELLKLCWDTNPNKRPPFLDIRKRLEHLQRLQMRISNEAQKPINAYQLEHVERDFTADSSSLKPMELVGSNSPAPKAFDADSSKMANSNPDPDALLRKGKAVVTEFPEPEKVIPSVLTSVVPEGETLNDYYDSIQNSRPDDIRSSDHFRDDYDVHLNVHHGPGTSTFDEQTFETWRPHKRRRKSSSVVTHNDYDVFLSHRGPDAAHFVEHLHNALKAAGLNSFLGHNKLLIKDDPAFITSIDDAMEVAKVHVAIVSRGSADSEYCLNEVVAMMRSGKPVIPVFYDVRPQDLRLVNQGPFAAAFENHKSRRTPGQVEEWMGALGNLACITGFCFSKADYKGDRMELIYELVDAILSLLPVRKFEILEVDPYLVGLEVHVKTCISKLEEMSLDTRLLGIVGMGGIGKTSLAKAIYNHFIGKKEFQAMSFLEIDQSTTSSMGFGSSKPSRIQKQLLWDLLNIEDGNLQNYQYYFSELSKRGRVLILLDGIHTRDDFDTFIVSVNHLTPGSIIIATSRDQFLLKSIGYMVKNSYLHKVIPLDSNDSQKLFNRWAFGSKKVPEKFEAIAHDVCEACGGLPLALKVIGSALFDKKSDEDLEIIWPEAISALAQDQDVMTALRWSYDSLPNEEKLMFLDIACLFCGWRKEEALEVWKSCIRTPHTSLRFLIYKSLVTLLYSPLGDEYLAMHSLLQEMGKNIGRLDRSHLRLGDAVKSVHEESQRSSNVRALDLANDWKHKFDPQRFESMPNLHFLILDGCVVTGDVTNISRELRYFQWRYMPLTQLPRVSDLSNLTSLDFSRSTGLGNTWADPFFKACPNLLRLNLSEGISITTLPDSIGHLSRLRVLELHGCRKLQKLPSSIGQLTALDELNLKGCASLETLPDSMTALSRLQRLHMEGCSSISKLPEGIGLLFSLTSLSMDLAFESQALSIGLLIALRHLSVRQCTDEAISAVDSSDALINLNRLVQFRFSNCKLLTKLPDTIWQLTRLEELHLYDCEKLQELPNSIGQLKALETLDLIKCSSLETLPSSLGALTSLRSLIILQCTSITMLPMSIGNLSNLHELTIEGSGKLQSLPDSIRQLNELRILQILDCGSLESLGALRVLGGLRIWGCTSITTLTGSCLIVLDSCFWDPTWYYSMFVRRNLKELRVVEANDCGFLRLVQDTESGRSILQRVHKVDRCKLIML